MGDSILHAKHICYMLLRAKDRLAYAAFCRLVCMVIKYCRVGRCRNWTEPNYRYLLFFSTVHGIATSITRYRHWLLKVRYWFSFCNILVAPKKVTP